jgi:hypothetical protein
LVSQHNKRDTTIAKGNRESRLKYETPDAVDNLLISKKDSESHDNFLDGLLGGRVNPLLFDDDSVQIKKEMEREKRQR